MERSEERVWKSIVISFALGDNEVFDITQDNCCQAIWLFPKAICEYNVHHCIHPGTRQSILREEQGYFLFHYEQCMAQPLYQTADGT